MAMHCVPTYDLFIFRSDEPSITLPRSSALPDVGFFSSTVVIKTIAEQKRSLFPGLVGKV